MRFSLKITAFLFLKTLKVLELVLRLSKKRTKWHFKPISCRFIWIKNCHFQKHIRELCDNLKFNLIYNISMVFRISACFLLWLTILIWKIYKVRVERNQQRQKRARYYRNFFFLGFSPTPYNHHTIIQNLNIDHAKAWINSFLFFDFSNKIW